jgi:mRNA-degrading endonuclease toxin of MazEF toxin-antitoxin module
VILVPLTQDEGFAIADLSVVIEPDAANGCKARSHALAHCVAATSKRRVTPTGSHITDEQLLDIRRKIALSIGI